MARTYYADSDLTATEQPRIGEVWFSPDTGNTCRIHDITEHGVQIEALTGGRFSDRTEDNLYFFTWAVFNHSMRPFPQPYVGCRDGARTVFHATRTPTDESHGSQYHAVIGPFDTLKAAQFMASPGGRNNPHCQCVEDAERIVKQS